MRGSLFLHLLLEESEPDAFVACAATLRSGLGEQERAEVDEALAVALEVRAVLEHRAHRQRELKALYETAGDLSSLRDLDRVLEAIVDRARELLGSDAAYLTLIDPDRGDTYMRVTSGIRTDAFKRVRLDLGAGLGGLVAQQVRPHATPDYLTDGQFAHTDVVDGAVSGEGLVAILGVPLALGEQVLGVLFSANRRERPFAEEEVALLSSLAAHAAIAIENARLFQDLQATLAELRSANAVISEHGALIERTAALHERLSSLVLEGGGIADVAVALGEVLGGHLLVVDALDRVVATAGEPVDTFGRTAADQRVLPSGGSARAAIERALTAARASGRSSPVKPGSSGASRWVTPVLAGAEHLGALVATRRTPMTDADLRALERAAQVTALLLLNERSLAEAEQRVRGELLDDLLAVPQRDVEGLRRRAALVGADLDREHVVVVADAANGDRRAVQAAATRLVVDGRGLASLHGGNVVLLLPGAEPGATDAIAQSLRATAIEPITVGGAGPAAGPAALAAAHREAVRCIAVLRAIGRAGDTATTAELGVYGLLLGQAGRTELDRFLRSVLGPVLDYDDAHATELERTIMTYLDAGGSLVRSSQALAVHVNTLRQRLERVDRLLGPAWRDAEGSLQIRIALRVRQLLAAGASPGMEETSTLHRSTRMIPT